MQKRLMVSVLVTIVLAGVAAAQQCTTPTDAQAFLTDTSLCAGTYDLPSGIVLGANAVLDCAGATIRGAGSNTGITVAGDNAQMRNCVIQGYAVGLRAENVQGFVEQGNSFANNGKDRSIIAGEQVSLPAIQPVSTTNSTTTNPTPPAQNPPVTTPNVAQPRPTIEPDIAPIPPAPSKTNTSIWLVASVKSEQLLENAMSFEYETGKVPETVLAERIAELQQTFNDVTIERTFIYSNGRTRVQVRVIPKSGFFSRVQYENVTLYEYIPKCFAQLVDEVVFEGGNPIVLERDPLLKKVLPKDQPLELSYSAFKSISKECQELFRVVGVGSGRKVNTLSNVLAEKGVLEVVRVFPGESLAVVVFLGLLGSGGVWYKKRIHEMN